MNFVDLASTQLLFFQVSCLEMKLIFENIALLESINNFSLVVTRKYLDQTLKRHTGAILNMH